MSDERPTPRSDVFIASKRLTYHGPSDFGFGEARIYTPVTDGRGWWFCDYELKWPGFECRRAAEGADSYLAMSLALQMVPVEIATTDDFKNGRIGTRERLEDEERMNSIDDLKRVFDVPRLRGIEL